ncbi:hypothetical protein RRG08_050192 [Elysia crispata]|uniref:Uncharacterized protein n=1 Tax=Elysia crispata TaxID=231223 RepID=A0AAE1DBY7_9GAST|nr:hypothetical protein RRG08_050192 [Elysia crispata]
MSSPSQTQTLLDKGEIAMISASPVDSLNNSGTEEQLLDISENQNNDEIENKEVNPDSWQEPLDHPQNHDPGVVDPQHVTVEVGKAKNGDSTAVNATKLPFTQNTDITSMDSIVPENDAAFIDVEHTIQDGLRDSGLSSSSNIVKQREDSNHVAEKFSSATESNPNSDLSHMSTSPPPQTFESDIPNEKSLSGSNNNNDSKKKKPLQVSASLSYETEEKYPRASSPRTRLHMEDRRSNSLDVPSIRIRSEDDSSDEDRNSSSGKNDLNDNNNAKQESAVSYPDTTDLLPNRSSTQENHVNGQSGGTSQSPAKSEDKRSANIKPNEEPKAMQVGSHIKSSDNPSPHSGGPCGSKLSTSYSLDVPEPKNLSLSLNRLDPNKRRRSQGEGILVQDKLITSNSMSRLPDGRRKSWASDASPRSSKGSIFDGKLP